MTSAEDRLGDRPDWGYLLREFEALYRAGSAAGSKPIRAHRKQVRERLSAVIDANPEMTHRPAEDKPVTLHLGRALDIGERGAVAGMARAVSRVAAQFTWEYGYENPPKSLARKFAYAEILGPRGPVHCDRLILGFVLFAPATTYPQHDHKDIEESYISVAGSWSENDAAVYAPGSLILNRPEVEHRITTGPEEPCLLAYAWIGPEERLGNPDMKLSRNKKSG